MKDMAKMWLCITALMIMMIISQIYLGNKPAIIMAFVVMFSVGFGWYARGSKLNDVTSEGNE